MMIIVNWIAVNYFWMYETVPHGGHGARENGWGGGNIINHSKYPDYNLIPTNPLSKI